MSEPLVRQSVLDRLTRRDLLYQGAGDRGRTPRTWDESAELLKRNLLRDLEWLLNTRQVSEPADETYPHLRRSVYNYGLRDISTFSADASETADELRKVIEDTIESFEPRLADVRVRLEADADSRHRTVRFHIEGTLRTEPDPEQIAFDTVLEITSKRFELTTAATGA
ncbi:MAG: type VI secretion system baseplate subunit TssE [Gemmatimonadota bacterium]|nr:type VI secretion system baseplate subunit TssE [Gemmatimonadota bacterium]